MKKVKKIIRAGAYAFRDAGVKASAAVSVLMIIISVSVAFFYWAPVKGRLTELKSGINSVKTLIAHREESSLVRAVYDEKAALLASMEKRLASDAGSGDITAELGAMAKKSGLKLSVENSSSSSDRVAGYLLTSRDITVTGKYEGLRELLYGIENMSVLTEIDRVRIEREGKEKGMIKASVKFTVFAKEPGGAGRAR